MAIPRRYRGFTTQNAERTRTWALYDIDLIKHDLMNHFMTRIGERVMRPDFGCRIWDYVHDQLTNDVREIIIEEAKRVVSSDPRVRLVDVFIFDFDNGIRIEAVLNYVGTDIIDTLSVMFERRQSADF